MTNAFRSEQFHTELNKAPVLLMNQDNTLDYVINLNAIVTTVSNTRKKTMQKSTGLVICESYSKLET